MIPTLQAEGHQVIAVQYGLDSQAADVAATKRTLGRVSGPAILVGHSYGGAVIHVTMLSQPQLVLDVIRKAAKAAQGAAATA